MKNRLLTFFYFSLLLSVVSCSETKTIIELKADANASIQSGDVSTAIILVKNIIKENPNDGEARFMLGKVYTKNDDFINAEKELNKAKELNFISPDLKILIAKILLAKNEFDEVINTLDPSSFNSNENKILAHIMMGKAYLSQDNIKEAKKNIDKSNAIDSNSIHSILGLALISSYQSNTTQALKLIDKIIDKSSVLPEMLLLKGSIESKMKSFELAAETYSSYLKLKPKSLMAKTLVAHNLIRAEKFQKAQIVVDELLLITDQHPTVNLLAAQLALVAKKYELSKELSYKVLMSTNNGLAQMISGISDYYLNNDEQAYYQLNAIADDLPTSHKIHQILAVLQLKLGYTDELSKTLAKIDNQDVDNADLFVNIGKGLAQQGDFQGANQLFDRAVKISPNNAKIKTKQGTLKLLQNNDESGIEYLQEAITIDPTLKEANIALAMAYLKLNELGKATEIAEKWLSKDPNNIYALLLRGNIAIKATEFDLAKKYFNQAATIDNNNITSLFNLAVIEAEQKNYKASTEILYKLIDINKEYSQAYRLLINNSMQLNEEDELKNKLVELIKNYPKSVLPRIILSRKLNIEKKYQDANSILTALNNYEDLPAVYFSTLSHNYFTQKKYQEMEDLYSAWEKAQPNNVEAYTLHLKFLDQQKHYKSALKLSQTALKNKNLAKDFQLLSFESYFLLLTNQLEQASKKIHSLAQINPNDRFVLRIQGQISLIKKDYELAVQYLKKSFEQTGNIYTGLYLATAYTNLNDTDSAIKLLEAGLIKSPSNNIYRKFIAGLYMKNSPKDAIRHYQEVILNDPKDFIALNNLAWTVFQENDIEQAFKYASQAYNLAPEHPQISDTLAVILISKKQFKEAIDILTKAKVLAGSNTEIKLHLAKALIGNNNKKKAKELINNLSKEEKAQWKKEIDTLDI